MARISLAFIGLVFLVGCATIPSVPTEGGFSVWAASDLENVRGGASPVLETPGFYSHSQHTLELSAAVNETVAAQIVIYAQERSLSNVEIQAGDLVGPNYTTLPASQLTLYRAWYAASPGFSGWRLLTAELPPTKTEAADCLIPLGVGPLGQKIIVAGRRNQPIWLDVHVPPGLPAGMYTGPIRILAEGQPTYTLTLKLTVLDLSLPDQPTLPVAAGVNLTKLWQSTLRLDGKPHAPPRMVPSDPTFDRARAVLADTCRLLADHGLSPMLQGLSPAISTTAQGTLDVDFADATALLTPPPTAWDTATSSQPATQPEANAVAGKRSTNVAAKGSALVRYPFDPEYPNPDQFNGPESREYREAVRVYLQACKSWLEGRAPSALRVLDLTDFSQPTPQDYARLVRLASIVRGVDAESYSAVGQPTLPLAPVGWPGHFYQPLDLPGLLRVPPAEWLDPMAIPALADQGQRVAFRPTYPPFSPSLDIEADSADPVALVWVAWRYRLFGLWLDEVADWPSEPQYDVVPEVSAHCLLYPPAGENETAPYPSVRLKRLRRGLQDHAYLTLLSRLSDRGQEAGVANLDRNSRISETKQSCTDRLARLLVSFAGTEAYGENYRDARPGGWSDQASHYLLATQLLREGLKNGYAGQPIWPHNYLPLRKLESERMKLRVEVEGVRLAADQERPELVNVDYGLLFRNELEEPAQVQVKFGPLPAGWKAAVDQANAGRLNVQESRRLRLHAQAQTIPGGRGGAFYQPLLVETDTGWRTTVSARVAVLAVPRVDQSPKLDGDLSDWPMPLANLAGDFRVPGRNAGSPDLLAKPSQPTTALVTHDGKKMYIGIHAQESENTPRKTVAGNRLTHSGLLAWDEDLVQILLDPGSRGSGDASDLFVLTIKPTGTVIARRGADVNPPIGQSQPWATNAQVMVQTAPTGWTAEVAIPLADFGPGVDKLRFWGFDVVRHDSSTGQSSSWSGTGRHFYNTRSMGNLVLLAE